MPHGSVAAPSSRTMQLCRQSQALGAVQLTYLRPSLPHSKPPARLFLCRPSSLLSAQQCRPLLSAPQRAPRLGRHRQGLQPAGQGQQAHWVVAATAADAPGQQPPEEDPRHKPGFFRNMMKPIMDFGFGKATIWEGGVGLFVFSGIAFGLVLITWAKGGQLGRGGKGYNAILEFPLACGISVGTPVRIRGVAVGSALTVQPSLERVDVLVEMKDQSTVIPRNALIEANQSGLIAESLIDITPQLPIPAWQASPLDEECEAEGNIVCHQGRIKGQPGVAMDDLVYICTKLARQMDSQGIDKAFEAIDAATQTIEDARPLVARAIELVEEVVPLLHELREGGLVGNLEALTASASEAAADIHKLQAEVLTPDNVKALRESVRTLTRTLEHIEAVTGDLGTVTGDNRVKGNIKQLIEALSRLVSD